MSERKSWIQQRCERLLIIEQDTIQGLGEEKAHVFIDLFDDYLSIDTAIGGTYSKDERLTLVNHVFWGLMKDLDAFQFLFLAGSYPMLNRTLRLVWESMFRAYYAMTPDLHHPKMKAPAGTGPDDQIVWLESHKPRLDWKTCLGPVLCHLLPSAREKQHVFDDYHGRWNRLNEYAHASAYLTFRSIDDTSHHVVEGFNEKWALDTIDLAVNVFGLVWLAVLTVYERAAKRLEGASLRGKYRALDHIINNPSP